MFSGNRSGTGSDGCDLPPAPSYDAPPPARTRLRPAPSMIGTDIIIVGNVMTTADLQIDGTIEGDGCCGGLSQGVKAASRAM